MSTVTRNYKGSLTGAGNIPLYPAGLPAHMLPSAARLDAGSASKGEQRAATKVAVYAADTLGKSLSVQISGTASVAFEGTNDSPPDVAAYWFPLATALTASGVMSSSIPAAFVRARVASGSGTATVTYLGEND